MDKRDWTEGLPELMENYSEAQPEGLWDAVQAGMKAPRRRFAAVWWYAGGMLAAAAAVVLTVLLWPVRPEGVSIVPGNVVAQRPAEEELVVAPASREQKESVLCTGPEKTELGAQIEPILCTEPEKDEIRQQTEPDLPTETEKDEIRQQKEPVLTTEPEKVQTEQPVAKERVRPKMNRPRIINVQAGVSATGLTAQNVSTVSTGYGIPGGFGTKAMAASSTGAVVQMLSRNKASTTVTSHSQSAKIALGLKVNLLPKWGVETGLVHTTLRSEYATSAGSADSYTERKLDYLGIPLYLHWNALDWGRLHLYACAGPMLEFCSGGTTSTRSTLDGVRMSDDSGKVSVKDRLWSLGAAAGVQFQITNYGSLFVQPGFSYHFKGNPDVESFYTEHPASLNFTFGYRMTLF